MTGPVRGLDPFNPNDCDQNFHSTLAMSITVKHNVGVAAGSAFASRGDGIYYRCIVDSTDPKGGGNRNLSWRMGCYQDSTASVINDNYPDAAGNSLCPPAPVNMCGDGQSGGTPPGTTQPNITGCPPPGIPCDIIQSKPYIAIESAVYPTTLSGALDKGANTITFSVCIATGAAYPTGPFIYGAGSFDRRVMAGSFAVTTGIDSLANCQAGPPSFGGSVGPPVNVCTLPGTVCTATLVELGSKKCAVAAGCPVTAFPPATTPIAFGAALPAAMHVDSDNDGCSDTQELRPSSPLLGGQHDPWNQWDYMNATGDGVNRVDDILAVVDKYQRNDSDSTPGFPPYSLNGPGTADDYNPDTDRTAIPGSVSWGLGPPDGKVVVPDILAAVKSYHHDCRLAADMPVG